MKLKQVALLPLLLLAAAAWGQPATPKEIVNKELGVALTVPAGWIDDAAESADNTLAFHFRPSPTDVTLSVRVSEEGARSLRGLWTAFRYSVVVEQGGSILKDEVVKLGQAPGRALTYETYSDLGAEKHLQAQALLQRRLIVFEVNGPPAAFETRQKQIQVIMNSFRTMTPAPQETPEEIKSPEVLKSPTPGETKP